MKDELEEVPKMDTIQEVLIDGPEPGSRWSSVAFSSRIGKSPPGDGCE